MLSEASGSRFVTQARRGREIAAARVGRKHLASWLGPLALVLWPIIASAQSLPPSTTDNAGLDFFRPPPNMFQLEHEYRTTPGSSQDVTTETLNLRYDHSFDLAPMWTLVTRTDLPLLAKDATSSNNPNGNYLYGIGDADIQAAVIHDFDTRWAVGQTLSARGSGK
jgi:hypothetical protein